MPFGGAGPMHAAALARELEVERILCPRASGVLSALGLIASDRRRDTARTVMLRGDDLTAERIAREVRALRESLGAGLEGAEPETTYGMRYRGQAFELDVAGSVEPDPAELVERFADAHERRNGYRDPEADVELVNIRLAMVVPGATPSRRRRPPAASREEPPGAVRRSGSRLASCAASPRPDAVQPGRAYSSFPRRRSCCRPAGRPR